MRLVGNIYRKEQHHSNKYIRSISKTQRFIYRNHYLVMTDIELYRTERESKKSFKRR